MKKSKKKQLIITMLFQAANLCQKKCVDSENDLTLRQFMLLAAIDGSGLGSVSLAGLSEIFGGTRQNIKQLTDALTKKGYLTCAQSEQDKREILIALTDKAKQYLSDSDETAERFVQPALKGVSEKALDGALDCLEAIMENLGDEEQ